MDENRHIIGLDLIRFCAALMVMAYHYTFIQSHHITFGLVEYPNLEVAWGGVGVEIFFVLSGFVIAFTANNRSPGAFARSRFLRLYPAVWICATISLVAILPVSERSNLGIAVLYLKSLTIWPTHWPHAGRIDGVYWSLAVEMAFYAFFFAILLSGQFKRFGMWMVLLGLPSATIYTAMAFGLEAPWMHRSHVLSLLLIRHGLFFALGGLLWLAWVKKLSGWEAVFAQWFFFAGIVSHMLSPSPSPAVSALVWAVSTLAIIASVWGNGYLYKATARWHAAIRLIGLATYPLYLVHQEVGRVVMVYLLEMGLQKHVVLGITASLIIGLSLGIAAYLEPRLRHFVATGVRASSGTSVIKGNA